MLYETLAQKWRKLFLYILAVWLVASPSLKLIYEKSHLLVRGCVIVGKQFAQPYCRIFISFFFLRALGFPQIMSNVCCDSTKHEPILLSFCSILLTKLVKYTKKKSILKMSLNCSFSNQKTKDKCEKNSICIKKFTWVFSFYSFSCIMIFHSISLSLFKKKV